MLRESDFDVKIACHKDGKRIDEQQTDEKKPQHYAEHYPLQSS